MNISKQLEELIKKELTPVNVEQRYRELLDDIYPEVKIGYSTFLASDIVEKLSPTDFRCGVADYSGTDETLIELGGEYYDTAEVERFCEEQEAKEQIEEELKEATK